jgi:hypothetical protein
VRTRPRPERAVPHRLGRSALATQLHVSTAALPLHTLTPGDTFPVGAATICVSGYSARVRDVPQSRSDAVYARYGVVHTPYAHEVDHLISLELGGSNAVRNLWPEPYAGRWGARTKDALENRLHANVCSHSMSLRTAQHIEAANWVAAYRRYVGSPPAAARVAHHMPDKSVSKPQRTKGSCEPGYSPCLPVADDLNCGDLTASQRPVRVIGSDPFGLDADGDGIGCDS